MISRFRLGVGEQKKGWGTSGPVKLRGEVRETVDLWWGSGRGRRTVELKPLTGEGETAAETVRFVL